MAFICISFFAETIYTEAILKIGVPSKAFSLPEMHYKTKALFKTF